jgi:hypothetical protein
LNKDIEQLRIGPLTINYIYDSSNDTRSVQEQVNDLGLPVEQDNEVNALKVFIPVPPSFKKKGRLKGSRNRITDSIPLENRHTTRARDTVQDASLIVLIIKVNDLNNELIKDKSNAYYITFLARSETFKDPITLIKALS